MSAMLVESIKQLTDGITQFKLTTDTEDSMQEVLIMLTESITQLKLDVDLYKVNRYPIILNHSYTL